MIVGEELLGFGIWAPALTALGPGCAMSKFAILLAGDPPMSRPMTCESVSEFSARIQSYVFKMLKADSREFFREKSCQRDEAWNISTLPILEGKMNSGASLQG